VSGAQPYELELLPDAKPVAGQWDVSWTYGRSPRPDVVPIAAGLPGSTRRPTTSAADAAMSASTRSPRYRHVVECGEMEFSVGLRGGERRWVPCRPRCTRAHYGVGRNTVETCHACSNGSCEK
jgi:hypothetical protein